MAKYVLSRTHDASGKEVGWALVTVADDYNIVDPLPAPRSTDYFFDDKTKAIEMFHKLIDEPKSK